LVTIIKYIFRGHIVFEYIPNGVWKDFRDVEFKKNDKFVDLSEEEHF
jgi:hypothetical protein